MKTLSYLSSLFLMLLLLTGCGDNNSNDPAPATKTATFRVDFTQAGDYQKFVKIITIGGGDFKYTGTNDKMPAVLSGDNLKNPTFSVEAANVVELNISSITEFSAVEVGPANMTMKFSIYKNGTLLEEKNYTYNEATKETTEQLNYKAN